jgi:hypothetical protein
MFNPSLPGENIDAQGTSTGGRATLYMDDESYMFGKGVIKKQRGFFKYKKTKPSIFFLFLPKTVFEHVYISTTIVSVFHPFPSPPVL